MPKWGVTEDDLQHGNPWGLAAGLLRPAKTITDPVHGDIYINELERRLIDSAPMQRLRRVRQLGTTHLVYPGATHSRFSHSLGTLRAAQDLLDAVADNRRSPGHVRDLLDEWDDSSVDGEMPRRFAEATVLARVGALLHDMCHVPLGHTIEDDLKVLVPHDRNEIRFAALWTEFDPVARDAIEAAGDLKIELEHLILSKIDMPSEWESKYPFVEDIVGNTICADLMDYLKRDHFHSGLPMEIGHRFVDHFYVMPSDNVRHARKMVIRTSRKGQQRQDIKTELEKYLRYRYELTERVLTHHAKTSADAMIGKLLEMWSDATWLGKAADVHPDTVAQSHDEPLETVKSRIAALTTETVKRPEGRNADGSRRYRDVPKTIDAIDTLVREVLEREFTSRSDDGLLEHLSFAAKGLSSERWEGIGTLAQAVLDRKLFKRAARADSPEDLAEAAQTYRKFGSADARRQLEQDAARFAGVNPGWKLVIWLPEPTMRLKVAEVLVDSGKGIAALDSLGGPSQQIVQAHRELWACTIYVEPELARTEELRVKAMLAILKDVLDLALHDTAGQPVRGVRQLALDLVAEANHLTAGQVPRLDEAMQMTIAAAGGGDFNAVLAATWEQARTAGLTSDAFPSRHWSTWDGRQRD
jgi:HD superfamily phosphohydrolase